MKKEVPKFKDLAEEVEFWETHSVADYLDEEDISDFLRLGGKKSATITIRMEPLVREQTKRIAMEQGKNYQTLMREWIYEGLRSALEEKYGEKKAKDIDIALEVHSIKDILNNLSNCFLVDPEAIIELANMGKKAEEAGYAVKKKKAKSA